MHFDKTESDNTPLDSPDLQEAEGPWNPRKTLEAATTAVDMESLTRNGIGSLRVVSESRLVEVLDGIVEDIVEASVQKSVQESAQKLEQAPPSSLLDNDESPDTDWKGEADRLLAGDDNPVAVLPDTLPADPGPRDEEPPRVPDYPDGDSPTGSHRERFERLEGLAVQLSSMSRRLQSTLTRLDPPLPADSSAPSAASHDCLGVDSRRRLLIREMLLGPVPEPSDTASSG